MRRLRWIGSQSTHVLKVNAIGDRGADEEMDDLVCEVLVAQQPKRIVGPRSKVEEAFVTAEHQKEPVDIAQGNR